MAVLLPCSAAVPALVEVTEETAMAMFFLPVERHWPICSVFSSRLLAVFITSTLFWWTARPRSC